MVMNGFDIMICYDMNDCELCTSTYFHIFQPFQFDTVPAFVGHRPPLSFPRGPKRQTRGKRWTVLDGPLVGSRPRQLVAGWSNEESE